MNIIIEFRAGKTRKAPISEPHPIIISRIMDRYGLSPSVARTIAILAGIGGRV